MSNFNQFTHGNRTYLFVELPEEAKDVDIVGDEISYMLFNWAMDEDWEYNISLPKGDWKIVGIVKDLAETEISQLVNNYPDSNKVAFKNYAKDKLNNPWLTTAKESFHSLIRSNGLHVENPYEKPKTCCSGSIQSGCGCMGFPYNYHSQEELDMYFKAQQKTVGNTLLIIKEDK